MKKDNLNKIELLAPARNKESGKLAIICGADAVYIGPDKFGARAKVGNSLSDIEELIMFADQFYAKVYATINTLLFDDEIDEAVKLIHKLYKIGISGIIIQDMGLLEYDLPPVPIIASTQCFANTPEKVKFFQDLGFKRIILPRELSLKQVQDIRQYATDVELEYFVHGALCVSYSGQCYMSYSLGGRSGNRGVCAQPCRKLYSVFDSSGKMIVEDKHILSLKDLNQSHHLEELLDAGVTSFKIEGRLKDENYIKNIVSFYRQKLDTILIEKNLQRSSSGKSSVNFSPNPDKTFNRGYSDYFFTGEQKEITSINTPKMKGEFIGKVSYVSKKYFQTKFDQKFANGDGISFFHQDKSKCVGTKINKVEDKQNYPISMRHIKNGLSIYRNFDHKFNKILSNSNVQRKIDISIIFKQIGASYFVNVVDEDSNQFEVKLGEFTEAQNTEMSQKMIRESLAKTGNSIFNCTDVKMNFQQTPFIKKSEINQTRRDLLENFLKVRILNKPIYESKLEDNDIPYVTDSLDFRGNVINKKAESFYHKHGVNSIANGAELTRDFNNKTVMTTKYCIRKELGQCLLETKSQGSPEWLLKDSEENEFQLKFNCNVCEMEIVKK